LQGEIVSRISGLRAMSPARKDITSRAVVCHITIGHNPFDGRIFHKECLSLVRAGYDVHLVACHQSDETVDGVHIHGLPSPSNRKFLMLFWPWLALVKALSIPAEIYHFHDPQLILTGVLLRVISGARVIYDVHEDVAGQILTKFWIPRPLRRLISSVYRTIESVALLSMGVIESDMIEARYRQPVQSVRNFPIINEGNTVERDRSSFEGKAVLIYAGGISRDRGAFDMLDLARSLRHRGVGFEMLIVGPVYPPELMDRMRALVEQEDLGDRVRVMGAVPFPRALELIRTSTVGLSLLRPIPNYKYALPTKILEYMAAGLPVISSDLPCSRDYVDAAEAGILVDPENPEEAARATAELLGDPDRMLRYSRNGQGTVLERFNWQEESKLLLRFYQRMLGTEIAPDECFPHKRRRGVAALSRQAGRHV